MVQGQMRASRRKWCAWRDSNPRPPQKPLHVPSPSYAQSRAGSFVLPILGCVPPNGGAAGRTGRSHVGGEIFVFQMLQREYGNDIVTAASWKSENSRYVFADNDTDDGMGCDFAFTFGKRQYRVEVKATAGDDESFKLGSSEIALAMRLASGRAARNMRYVLVL